MISLFTLINNGDYIINYYFQPTNFKEVFLQKEKKKVINDSILQLLI